MVIGSFFVSASLLSTFGVSGKEVTIPLGKETIKGYLALPEKEGRHAAVVVVHEWWGLNDQIKGVADRLAKEGFLALVPDLYRGKVGTDAESAHELMRGLPEERAVADLKAAADFLARHERAAPSKLGIVGFCMGGRLSLLASIEDSRFGATVICYGRPETSPERLKKLSGALLGIFGGADQGIGPEQLEDLKKGLAAAGKTADIRVYPEAGHAFLNEKGKHYREKDASDAWTRILEFFRKSLAPSSG